MKTKPVGLSREHISPGTPIPWSNNPEILDLFFVGSGNAFSRKRGECNFVLGHAGMLFAGDVGRLWPERAENFGITPDKISGVLLSHCHSDHALGLANVIERRRYEHKLFTPLRLAAHPEVIELLLEGTLRGPLGGHEGLLATDFFEVAEAAMANDRCATVRLLPTLVVELFRTMHTPAAVSSWRESMPSTGVFLKRAGLWLSMDTRHELGLVESYVARGAEWLFHDVGRSATVHATLDEMVHWPRAIREKTHLMHSPDDMTEAEVQQLGFAGLVEPGDLFRLSPIRPWVSLPARV